jgi:hypothetical protein
MSFSTYQYARFCNALLTTSFVAVYTTPASTQAIVKTVVIANFGGSAATVTIDMPGGTGFLQESIPGDTTLILNCLVVLNTGEAITAEASAGATIYLTVSGQTGQ